MNFFTIIFVLPLYCYITYTTAKKANWDAAITESAETFSANFFKATAYYNNEDNIISSPASTNIILAMSAFGAEGNTAKEIQRAIQIPDEKAVALKVYQQILGDIKKNKNKEVTLNIATRIYINNNFKLKSDYKKLLNNYFYSDACEIDIDDPKKSAKMMNHWVEKNTEQKVHDIISEGDITDTTQIVLLNAIYFKGNWKYSFMKQSTENRAFHISKENVIEVPTMFNYDEYFTGDLPDLKSRFIVLPYKESDLSMIIILPHEIDGLIDVINNFNLYHFSRLENAGSLEKIYIYLPKFKIESTIDLKEPLEKLGVNDMFTDKANFSGIANHQLKVTKVIQKAFIDVNEEGTEAAAATVSMMVPYAYNPDPATIIINRPFLFEIIDTRTHVTIFVGAVTNPEKN